MSNTVLCLVFVGWAFSAISTLESQVAIKTGVQQTLSVEELVACENKVSNGCDGGMYVTTVSIPG